MQWTWFCLLQGFAYFLLFQTAALSFETSYPFPVGVARVPVPGISLAGPAQGPSEAASEGDAVTASTLLGNPILGEDGSTIATVEQLVIEPSSGRIAEVLISFEDEGSRTVAIPWSHLSVQPDGSLRLAVSATQLESGAPPQQPRAARPETAAAPETGTVQGTSPRISFAPNSVPELFDPGAIETVEGTLTGAVTAPANGRQRIVYIDTPFERIRLHLGPAWYLDDRGLALEPGKRIRVTGSKIEVEGSPVMIVTELTAAGRTVPLRNASDGSPLWGGSR